MAHDTLTDLAAALEKVDAGLGALPTRVEALVSDVLSNKRTATDALFPNAPVGKVVVITYVSTVHAYNLAVKVATAKWIHLRRMKNARDYGAALSGTNPLVDDSAAFITALAEKTAASGVSVPQGLWVPAGHALISASLAPTDSAYMQGEGLQSSYLLLADDVNLPILDSSAAQQKTMLRGLVFKPVNKANHAGMTEPLLRLTGTYLGTLQDLFVQNAPADAYLLGSGTSGAGSDSVRAYNVFATGAGGKGFFLDHHINGAFFGWDSEVNEEGMRWRGSNVRAFQSGVLAGGRTELNLDIGIELERAVGVHIKQHYSDNEASIYLGEGTALCSVEDGTFIGLAVGTPTSHNAIVTNLGAYNLIRGNDGICNPFSLPVEHYWPASCVPDPDESRLDTGAWKVSGATVTKTIEYHGVRMWRFFGKNPAKITSTVADTHYSYKEQAVTPGEAWWGHVSWCGDFAGGGVKQIRVRVVDDANPTTVELYNSGPLTPNNSGNGIDACDERHSFCCKVPTGVTKVRALIQPITATSVLCSRLDLIRSVAVSNPGMDSVTGYAYAAGIANGWSYLSGTGTPSQETTIVHRPGSAQRIVTTGGNSYFLYQTLSLDPDRYYHMRGFIYVVSGAPEYACMGLGDDLTGNYQVRIPVFKTGVWRGIDMIVRPGGYSKLIFGVLNTCDAIFKNFTFTPLRNEGEFAGKFRSDVLALGGAAASSYIWAPSIDDRIRRVKLVFTAATTGASAAVNVGVPGDPARFGTYTPPGVVTQWAEREVTLTRTDLRSINPATAGSLPLVISTPGGGAGGGSVFGSIEIGGGP